MDKVTKTEELADVVELCAWETIEDCLLPTAILTRTYRMGEKHFSHFHWPLLGQARQRGYTFEPIRFQINAYDDGMRFPDQRRCLLVSSLSSIHERRMLQFTVRFLDAAQPDRLIADCAVHLVEVTEVGGDWLASFAGIQDPIQSDVVKHLPDAGAQGEPVINTTTALLGVESRARWIGPAIVDHVVVSDYCEFVGMWTFLKATGPILDYGKHATAQLVGERETAGIPDPRTLPYRRWTLWGDMKFPLCLYDEFQVETRVARVENVLYFKHQSYRRLPRMPAQLFLERFEL